MANESVAFNFHAEKKRVLSQSVDADITRRRLPLVSPFIHSFWRVRLQKVTKPVSSVFA